MQYFPIIVLSLILLVSLARPLTVLFHELGHAIPAILLTRKRVTIYIGSFGNPANSLNLNLGKLSFKNDQNNAVSLNNKGYSLTVLKRYEEAIPFLDRAIEYDKNFAFAYNNRGLCKIKTGYQEEGFNDISYSLELKNDNSYAYRNLGIYHFDKGEYQRALELFLKAKGLDSSTPMIEELISEVKLRAPGSNFEL